MAVMTFASPAAAAPLKVVPFKVVIDPGHGGADLGTFQKAGEIQINEKDITLLLAKEIAKDLNSLGINSVLTRDRDESLPLGERTALANRLKADAFISIHMNSTPAKPKAASTIEGVETYILNNTTDASSRNLARLENTVLTPEEKASFESTDVALILRDLRLDANLSESKRMACVIQDRLAGSLGIKSRGVKQALFYVLLGAEMPCVLVEAGFLSSPKERARVQSPTGRRLIGSAIARAIAQFRDQRGTAQGRAVLNRCLVH